METALQKSNLEQFKTTADEIHEWSRYNFGDQEAIWPFMGIGEEIGELYAALDAHNNKEVLDALGDISIYFGDFCANAKYYPQEEDTSVPIPILSVSYGKLCHTLLKRQQKIRGMDDDTAYRQALQERVNGFYASLNNACFRLFERYAVDIMSEVWETIVKKRNWRKG